MPTRVPSAPVPEVYTAAEVARAAGVPPARVIDLAESGHVDRSHGFFRQSDAVRLVRLLKGRASPADGGGRPPLTLVRPARRNRGGLSFITSTAGHGALLLLLLLGSTFGWISAKDTDEPVRPDRPVRLVFMTLPGPGGGGGGGGQQMPAPPPAARLKAPAPKRVASAVPPVRPVAAPPRPRPVPRRPPPLVMAPARPRPEAPAPSLALSQAVQAPVVPIAGDQIELAGLPTAGPPAQTSSAGPGTGGGIGSGRGAGLGEGDGGGIGPGSGGGTGGGPYRPGSGIEPPTLVREVRASYTAEARRRALEGDVTLEVVVRRDGSVSDVRVTHGLGAGLDQKAVEAVRQWRFTPARRQGVPVDVVVTVSVEFTLR